MPVNTAKLVEPQYLVKDLVIGSDKETTASVPSDESIFVPKTRPVNVEIIWKSFEVPTAKPPTGDLLKEYVSGVIFIPINPYLEWPAEKRSDLGKEATRKYFELVGQLGEVPPEEIARLARERAWKQHKKFS